MQTGPELTNSRRERRVTIAICVFLTAIVWVVFAQTVRYEFINYDDDKYVYQSKEVSRGVTVEGLKWLLAHSHASLWHPLTTFSHMVDCQIYGLKAGGHHLTNVILQNIAAVLLFLVLRGVTGRIWPSAFVAAIFAIHPMRVESVAWVAERKDMLSGVFFALTIASYARYARVPSIQRYITMSLFVIGGLMSKATFVTVPVVLLLLDDWPLARGQRSQVTGQNGKGVWLKFVLEKIPLLVLAGAAAAVTLSAQTVTMPTLDQLPLLPRLKNAIVSLVIYLRQMFWPTGLAIFYPHPHDQLKNWVVVGSAILLIAITAVAVVLRKKYPYLLTGWLWYLILVFPVLGFFQAGLQARADRFTYLPHIGITIAVTWLIADLTQKWRHQRAVLGSVAISVIVVLGCCAWKQTHYWRDSVTLWQRTLAVTSDNQIAHQDLAAALWDRGQMDESHKHAQMAAIIHDQVNLKDYPFDVPTRDELGVLLVQSGDTRGAIAEWSKSLQINPNDGNALNDLAWLLATCPDDSVRNGNQAVDLAEKAVALPRGDAPMVLRTLAAAYAENNDFARAVDTAQRAMNSAMEQKNSSLAETLRHELEFYQAGKPYRESPVK